MKPALAELASGTAPKAGAAPGPGVSPLDQELLARLRKRELKGLTDAARPLDSWERYRALNDAMDEAYELIDIQNREARFALILMGGLNAAVMLAATRTELLTALPKTSKVWAGVLLVVYGIVAFGLMLQAVDALRPGHFRPKLGQWPKDADDFPKGVRYFEDVIERDAASYWQAWREVRIAQLNAELAVQVHSLSIKTNVKRVALRRLYSGLRIMTLLLAALTALFVASAWL
jgi:hypothetical protein